MAALTVGRTEKTCRLPSPAFLKVANEADGHRLVEVAMVGPGDEVLPHASGVYWS
jgi:hypothetical protein